MREFQAVLYIADLAELLGRTEAAIRSAHQRGRIPGAFTLLGRTAWDRTAIEAWLGASMQGTIAAEAQKRGRKRKGYEVELTPSQRQQNRH